MFDDQGPFVWRHLRDLDLSVGILTDLKKIIDMGEFAATPQIIHEMEERYQLASKFPDWAGDGILLKLGNEWTKRTP